MEDYVLIRRVKELRRCERLVAASQAGSADRVRYVSRLFQLRGEIAAELGIPMPAPEWTEAISIPTVGATITMEVCDGD